MKGKDQDHINIEHPEAYELLVAIGERRVDYMLYAPSVAGSLIYGDMAMSDDSLQSLEDAIYDLPLLLDEYRRVRVVVHSRHFVLFPVDVANDDCTLLAREAFPGDEGDAAVCDMPLNGVKVAYLMPRGMEAFLGRTFNYPELCHHLMPLCEYFKGQNGGDSLSRMFLTLSDGEMDMVIYRDGALQCANSYASASVQDAAYFAMNAWRAHDLDQLTDELHLMGDAELRSEMTPLLREYVKYVMPAVFPAAAMRLGRDAMQAPLELILLALCE